MRLRLVFFGILIASACVHGPGSARAQDVVQEVGPDIETDAPSVPVKPLNDSGSESDAFRKLAAAAGEGDAPAQLKLGLAYLDGKQLPRDTQLAAHWIREAAQQNLPEAEVQWAKLEQQGLGTKLNPDDAFAWLRRATDQKSAEGAYLLATALHDGIGTPIDAGEAAHWYVLAAQAGSVDAQIALGQAFLKGDGIAPDAAQAIYWFHRASDQGSAEARYRWALALLGDETGGLASPPTHDSVEGFKILRQAADQNYPPAEFRLGLAYLNGTEAEYDPKIALRLIGAAADRGYGKALVRLGLIYAEGKLVRPDPVRAYVNLELAVELGEVGAAAARNTAAAALPPDQVQQVRRRIRDWRTNRGL
ncbi:MAG TPA: tetratricopeptide repeat protein [Magnetospirillaceae bacterium]